MKTIIQIENSVTKEHKNIEKAKKRHLKCQIEPYLTPFFINLYI